MREHTTVKGDDAKNAGSYLYQWLYELAIESMTPDIDEDAASEKLSALIETIKTLGKDGIHQSWFRINAEEFEFEAHLILTVKEKQISS